MWRRDIWTVKGTELERLEAGRWDRKGQREKEGRGEQGSDGGGGGGSKHTRPLGGKQTAAVRNKWIGGGRHKRSYRDSKIINK